MKFLVPLIKKAAQSGVSLLGRATEKKTEPTSFGQRRAEELTSRLHKAQEERQKLIRAEYATSGSVQETIQQKRFQTDRTVQRLSAEKKYK